MPNPPMADYEVLYDDQSVPSQTAGATGPVIININTVNVNGNTGYYGGEPISNKSLGLTLVLAVFFGIFGIHCFYVGRIGRGILFFFTMGLFGLGWLWDIVMILFRRYRDGAGWLIAT